MLSKTRQGQVMGSVANHAAGPAMSRTDRAAACHKSCKAAMIELRGN